jgi:putative transposase
MTVYVDKQKLVNYRKSKIEKNKYVKPEEEIVGIDFGCETSFTLSTGEKFSLLVEENEHHKQLQRRLQRCRKGSNNWYKVKQELLESYAKMNNKKDELAREFVHYLKSHHDTIVMQDENLSGWLKTNHGKKIWHSVLGRVKELLMNEQFIKVVVLDRFIPTTKFCPHCGQMHRFLQLWDREYVCPNCKRQMDRDVHAAQNMVWIYKECLKYHIIPADGWEITRADFDRLVSMVFSGNANRVEGMLDDCNRPEYRCCCRQMSEMSSVETHEAQPVRVCKTSFY